MLTTWLGRAWWSTALRPHPRHRGDDVIDLDRYVLQPCMATCRGCWCSGARRVRTSPALPARTTQSADKYAVFKASVAEHYRRCESMRDRASWRVPATRRGRERSRSAAEGATGPRKRSGNRDRAGIRDLWKAGRQPIGPPHRRSKKRPGQHHPGALNLSGRPTGGSPEPAHRRTVTLPAERTSDRECAA